MAVYVALTVGALINEASVAFDTPEEPARAAAAEIAALAPLTWMAVPDVASPATTKTHHIINTARKMTVMTGKLWLGWG